MDTSNISQRAAAAGSTFQFIAECFTNHKLQSKFVSFFYEQPPAVDKIIVLYLTIVDVILLLFISFFTVDLPLLQILILSFFPLSTILSASYFALTLNKILSDYDKTLEITYKTYLPYGNNGITIDAEQRAAGKATLIALAAWCMKNSGDAKAVTKMKELINNADEDPDMGDLLDHHALVKYVRKHIAT